MLFELDIGPLSLDRARSRELEQQIEGLIEDYRRKHPGVSEQEIQDAIQLLRMQVAAQHDTDRNETELTDSDESLRGRFLGVFMLAAIVVAGAFLYFLIRRP